MSTFSAQAEPAISRTTKSLNDPQAVTRLTTGAATDDDHRTNRFPTHSVDSAVARLEELGSTCEPRSGGRYFMCRCPRPEHDDRNPSMKLAMGRTGQIVVHCFACGPKYTGEILRIIGPVHGKHPQPPAIVTAGHLDSPERGCRVSSVEVHDLRHGTPTLRDGVAAIGPRTEMRMGATMWTALRLLAHKFNRRQRSGHAHRDDAIPFSANELADKAKVSKKSAQRAIKALRNAGLIEKLDELPAIKKGNGVSLYALVLDGPFPLTAGNVEAAPVVVGLDAHDSAATSDRHVAVEPVVEEHEVAGVTFAELAARSGLRLATTERGALLQSGVHENPLYAPLPTPSGDGLDTALALAERGMKVFPIQAGSKVPYPKSRGFKDATDDADQLAKWWTVAPDSNLAIRTGAESGIVVLDVDGPSGMYSGAWTLDAMEHFHGPLPLTARVLTPSGGSHFYFQHPGVPIRSRTAVMGDPDFGTPGQIDVRGEGGYVLAPPSVRDDGAGYVVVDPDAPIAPMPDWLVRVLLDE